MCAGVSPRGPSPAGGLLQDPAPSSQIMSPEPIERQFGTRLTQTCPLGACPVPGTVTEASRICANFVTDGAARTLAAYPRRNAAPATDRGSPRVLPRRHTWQLEAADRVRRLAPAALLCARDPRSPAVRLDDRR